MNHNVVDFFPCVGQEANLKTNLGRKKKKRSTLVSLTVTAAVCNICPAHPLTTCLCNGYEEVNHISTQFYFLVMFKIEQALEYLSQGKFQYCNICFCQEARWKFSITVVFFAYGGKKKSFKNVSFRNLETLLSISLQLWDWYPHPKCTLCQGGCCFLKWVIFTLLCGQGRESKVNMIHFPLPPCVFSLLSAFAVVKGWPGCRRGKDSFLLGTVKGGEDAVKEQSKDWKQSTPHRCQGKKSTGAHHSYSFHFSLPNRRQ